MHIVAHEGQVLKARTVTRLVKNQQFNAVEFNKIVLPPHESEPHYQEPQEDRIALQELLRSFIMQQQPKMKIQDFKPSDQRFNVTVEHAEPIITASSAEGANQRSATASTATSSAQPLIIPHPPGLQSQPQQVPSQPQVPQQPQQAPQVQPQQPVQVRRRIRTKSRPQDVSEISAVLQDIKENHLSVGRDQINADHQEAQSEEELLQGLILQEWYQGDLQGYSADQIKEAITKELKQIGPQGHDAYDPVPLSQLSPEERRSIIESRWVIGPRPGSELKGRFCAKGFKQVISRDDKYASTPQATTLKLILLMSQIHSWEIAVSDIASAFLNTLVDPSKPPIYVQAPREIQYSEPTIWRLKRQLYGLRDAPKSWQAHFSQIMIKKGMTQIKSDSCTSLKKDKDGHVQLVVMAYVDDRVISGNAQMVKVSLSGFRKSSPSSTSISSLQRSQWSSWAEQSRDSRMAISLWSSLRSSLTICSKSSRSLERSPQQVSNFKFFQKIRRFSVIVSFIRSIGQQLGNYYGWLSSGMTSSIRSKSFQGHSSIRKIRMSRI